MTSTDVRAVDVHAHYGLYQREKASALLESFSTGDADEVVRRAEQANVRITVVSPLSGLLPRGDCDVVKGNMEARETVRNRPSLRQWVILHPTVAETYEQAVDILKDRCCVGIKLHPEEHCYPIAEYGNRLFEFASEHKAVVLIHSGDHNSRPSQCVEFANRYPDIQLILAHLGNGGAAAGDPTLQVQAVQSSRHGNVFVDTSSARSILPGLVEWAVGEVGAEKILFGTDAPLYHTAMQRARVDSADIDEKDKVRILCGNAESILQL